MLKPSSTDPSLPHQIDFLQRTFGMAPAEIYEALVLGGMPETDWYWRIIINGTRELPKATFEV